MNKEKIIQITKAFTITVFVLIALYDFWAMSKGDTEASISHAMIVWSYNYPIFTFAFGVLCGHLFWRVRGTKELRKIEDETRE